MNWSQQSIEFVTCLISGHFRSLFEGAHQFWLRGWAGGRPRVGGGVGGGKSL